MKKLTVKNITDGINTISTSKFVENVPNAWGTLNNSGTPSVYQSFGLSSVTDGASAGEAYWNFSNPFANENYAVAGHGVRSLGDTASLFTDHFGLRRSADRKTTLRARSITNLAGNVTGTDVPFVRAAFIGEVA